MSNEDILTICAIFLTVGFWKFVGALRGIAFALRSLVPRSIQFNSTVRHQMEERKEPWEE